MGMGVVAGGHFKPQGVGEHQTVRLQPDGPTFLVSRAAHERVAYPTHHAVTFAPGAPTLLVQGHPPLEAPIARLQPEMHDHNAVKALTRDGLTEGALTLASGGGAFVARVGVKNLLMPVLERAGARTLLTAVELLGEVGRRTKGGSDLGLRDWLTVGLPFSWNKKKPEYQQTLSVLTSLSEINEKNLSEMKRQHVDAQKIESAYLAIKEWMRVNESAIKDPGFNRPAEGVVEGSYNAWFGQLARSKDRRRIADRYEHNRNAYVQAVQALKSMGRDTGLEDNIFSAAGVRTDDKAWEKMIAATKNIPQQKAEVARLGAEVNDLSDLGKGLKLILNWLL